MAISDVLFEARNDIRSYMTKLPETYEDMKPRLERLLSEMDSIRSELDTAPSKRRTLRD